MKNFSLKDIRRVSVALSEEAKGKEECSIYHIRDAALMLRELAQIKIRNARLNHPKKHKTPTVPRTLAQELNYKPEEFSKSLREEEEKERKENEFTQG